MESKDRKPILGKVIQWVIFIILILIIIFLLLRCCSCDKCNGENSGVIRVESVSVYPESLNMKVGDTKLLTVIITPSDATNKDYSCKSSDEAVVIVDENCTVTAVGEGEATVVVKTDDGDITVTVDVTVTKDEEEKPEEKPGDPQDKTLKAPGLAFKCGSAVYQNNTWCNTNITSSITGVPSGGIKRSCSKTGSSKCNPYTEKYNEIVKSGTYTVCVGYVLNGVQSKTTCKTIVAKIDKTAPTCKYAVSSNKVIATCVDSESGIGYITPGWNKTGKDTYEQTLGVTEGTVKLPLTVKDNAGNQYSGYAMVKISLKVCPDGYQTYYFGSNCYKRVGTATNTWVKGDKFCCNAPTCDAYQPRTVNAGESVGYYYSCGASDECQHQTDYVGEYPGSCVKYTLTPTCSVSGSFAFEGYCYYSANKVNKYTYSLIEYK